MGAEKEWLKFIISGKVEDYLKYTNSVKNYRDFGGEDNVFVNRRIGNKGNGRRGEQPSCNNPYEK